MASQDSHKGPESQRSTNAQSRGGKGDPNSTLIVDFSPVWVEPAEPLNSEFIPVPIEGGQTAFSQPECGVPRMVGRRVLSAGYRIPSTESTWLAGRINKSNWITWTVGHGGLSGAGVGDV